MKDVAEAMVGGINENASNYSKRKNMTISNSRMTENEESHRYVDIPSNKLPSTHVNQDKLKMVLRQLKKSERGGMHTSR